METRRTDAIIEGLKRLPSIGQSSVESLSTRIRAAEIAVMEAQAKLEKEIERLADSLTEEGDGWTFDEIWQTNLRGDARLIKYLREQGKDKDNKWPA